MAVEVKESSVRQVVTVTWDKSVVTGEIVQLYCVNSETGEVSQSGFSANDGEGFVTYPKDYSGSSEVTVYDNDGNADVGVITVDGEDANTDPDAKPEHPIVLPPDSGLKPEHPIVIPPDPNDPRPEHPIELPPDGIWGPDDPRPDHPIVIPPDAWPEHPIVIPPDGLPSHPIVIPPDLGYNPPPGASVPTPHDK